MAVPMGQVPLVHMDRPVSVQVRGALPLVSLKVSSSPLAPGATRMETGAVVLEGAVTMVFRSE